MATPTESKIERVHRELIAKGYTRIKMGAVNMPGYSRIETWMKRSGTVYLVFNEAEEWDILKSAFTADPTPDSLKESTAF